MDWEMDENTESFIRSLQNHNPMWFQILLDSCGYGNLLARTVIDEAIKYLPGFAYYKDKINHFQVMKAVREGKVKKDEFCYASELIFDKYREGLITRIKNEGMFSNSKPLYKS